MRVWEKYRKLEKAPVWWSHLCKHVLSADWFVENTVKELMEWDKTSFCHEKWTEEVVWLVCSYNILFRIGSDKEVCLKDKGKWE